MPLSAKLHEFQNLTPQQWLDRASQSAPQLVMVVLVIAIAWQLVQLTWLLLDRGPQPQAPTAPPPMNVPPVRSGVDIQAIVNAHLFDVAAAQAPQDAASAPETQMNLVLSAVFASEDPNKGLAIIGESAQAAKVFAVGSTVRPGTKLHAVYIDRVILDRNGSLEALALPKRTSGALVINRPPPPPQNQFTENLRRIAESNPSAFAEIIRPQPVFANGVQRGYRVYPGRNRAQFSKLGLVPGDLVLSINGTPLDDPQRGLEIFNTMGSADRVNVTVERNGQSQELTLNMAQVSLPDPNAAPQTRGGGQRPTPTPPAE
ncbi:type II secretion system protein GspC [Steroidobacter sp.]|uniref:type II secretion system protein GspC n=1 Tax=Steroidobacter sp. TaxID=1978227 RepID=UPI001A619AA4|nr:type II secretion system protein GspC [Steroidobacter sp.]MBL8265519.1 type II secretion system protein GspC [Steroidobacter sp.]